MATISSSSSFTYKWTYDVFINFRGVDTRRGFTGNLFKDLRQTKEIKAFMDDQDLEPGAEITPTLVKAIEESRIALVIFSKNYAASTYCLEELAKIMECSNKTGMLVWPVFYHVDPAEVRYHQKGSYAEALAKHKARNYEKQKLEKWKLALEKTAGLSGWHIKLDADKYEYEYIEEIIQKISKKISSRRDGDMNQAMQISHHCFHPEQPKPQNDHGSSTEENSYLASRFTTMSGTSSGSSAIPTSGSEEDLQLLMDQGRRKRTISNRESARRSRIRKQKHLDDLFSQVAQHKNDNHQILTSLNETTHHYLTIKAENSVLRAQVGELSHRLESLKEIIDFSNASNGVFGGVDAPNTFIEPANSFFYPSI